MGNISFEKLTKTIAKLRDPQDGCPWDLKQDHESLLKYLVEESYEYIHAVEQGEASKMKEELGDVLLQVVLHAQIAQDNNTFDINDVCESINSKMIERHPHVFAQGSKELSDIENNWEKIKKKKSKYFYNTDDLHIPPLLCAQKIGIKAQRINFDWDLPDQVLEKVDEELAELKIELKTGDKEKIKEELGDLLFSIVQLARHLDLDASETLRSANKKFITRFNKIEDQLIDQGKDLFETSQDELENAWQQVKKTTY